MCAMLKVTADASEKMLSTKVGLVVHAEQHICGLFGDADAFE
jgi:hypothetical protein